MAQMEQAIFTNMCMVTDGNGNVLVQDRVKDDWAGIGFPGGHVEPGESFVQSVIREVWEETGLTIAHPRLCGIKQFRQQSSGARYVVLFFRADEFSGELKGSEEGEVYWVRRDELENYQLADHFMDMVRIFEDDSLSECHWNGNGYDFW